MKSGPTLSAHLASRLKALRKERGLALAELASRSGVSRSMLSLMERGETSPTAVVLEKVATALGVMLADLFPGPKAEVGARTSLARRSEQVAWTDPASGYERRNVSPAPTGLPFQIVEVNFPAGQRVHFETTWRAQRVHQQIWMLQGSMEVRLGNETFRLAKGDCLAMELDRPSHFHNPTRSDARYAVVIAQEPLRRHES